MEEKVGEGRGGALRNPLSFLAEETEPLHAGSGSGFPALPLGSPKVKLERVWRRASSGLFWKSPVHSFFLGSLTD